MDPRIDRRKFLISGASLAGAISLPSVARATQPSPAYVGVKLLVLDYQPMTLDRDLRSIVPDWGDMLPSLANHAKARIVELGANIQVAERPTYVRRPEGVTEPQTLYATVLLDLARWEDDNDKVVGGILIEVSRPFLEGSLTFLLRPIAFFGAAARKESVAQEVARAAREKLDQLIHPITLYK